MRFYLIILLSFCGISGLAAQTNLEGNVREMFDDKGSIKWMKHYKGRFDDMNDVAITLAYDGVKLKGEMVYLRSKTHFFLVGEMKGKTFLLQEYDGNDLVTGYLKGEIDGGKIKGEWSNFNNTLGAKLELEELSSKERKLLEVPTYCGDNKWVRFYKGEIGKEEVELVLQKNGGRKITGTILFAGGSSQSISGHFDSFNNLLLKIENEMRQPLGRLEGTFDNKNKFNANYIDAKNKEYSCSLKIVDELAIGGVEYADYISNYDILYPKIQNDAYTKWINDIVNAWIASCRQHADNIAMTNNPKPDTRYSVRAQAWSEVDMFNDDFISGQLIFSNTWQDKPVSRNLNFDLRNGKEILAEDIFLPDFDYKKYVKKYIVNRLLQHKWAEDKDFRAWLDGQAFNIFNFRKDGLYFSTDFNPVFGRQEAIIPYKKLKFFFKEHPVVEKCTKGKF